MRKNGFSKLIAPGGSQALCVPLWEILIREAREGTFK
jgi:hypothetical protein